MPPIAGHFLLLTTNGRDVNARWHEIVGGYSGLDLSFGKDKFPAISGAAKQMGTVQHGKLGRYLAGLWENNLDVDFFWIPRGKLRSRPKL
jgi:hypothetical protein